MTQLTWYEKRESGARNFVLSKFCFNTFLFTFHWEELSHIASPHGKGSWKIRVKTGWSHAPEEGESVQQIAFCYTIPRLVSKNLIRGQ